MWLSFSQKRPALPQAVNILHCWRHARDTTAAAGSGKKFRKDPFYL